MFLYYIPPRIYNAKELKQKGSIKQTNDSLRRFLWEITKKKYIYSKYLHIQNNVNKKFVDCTKK